MPPPPRGGWLPSLALTRTVTARMLLLALVAVGVIVWRGMPVELIPSGFTPPFLFVQVPTLRAAPADIEQRIAIPAEELLATVRNVNRIGTRIGTNSASFLMEFRDGTDMDAAWNQVRDRLDRLRPELGDEMGRTLIWKYNPADDPMVWFGLSGTAHRTLSAATVDAVITPRLERIPGVSRVEAFGAAEPTVIIALDEPAVASAGLTVAELVEQLARDNFALAVGSIEDAGRVIPLRLTARFGSVEELRETPVGNGRRLGDVARVEVEDRADDALFRVNGEDAVMLAVYREAGANAVETSARVVRALEHELPGDPALEGLSLHVFFAQGDVITEALDNLGQTALWGGAFAVLVLFLFLRRPGMTLVVAAAIPLSMLLTLVVMQAMGRTLNVLSLTGMMLAVGMVVDNAIVVTENIQRRRQEGLPPREAALHGAAEVALAITVATLTTVVVFLPLILMSGSETLSFYLAEIGLPVCAGLLASLLVSLFFLPLASVMALGQGLPPDLPAVRWLEDALFRLVTLALRRRGDAFLIILLAFATVAWPLPRVIQTDRAEANINDFRVWMTFDDRTGPDERRAAASMAEAALLEAADELGIAHLMLRYGSGVARPQLRAFLRPPGERALDREEIIERAVERLPSVPGMNVSLAWDSTGSPNEPVTVRVVGPDSNRLAELGDAFGQRLRLIPGIRSVQVEGGEAGREELHLRVDRERSSRLGLSPMMVGAVVDYSLRGRRLPDLQREGDVLPVRVEGEGTERRELVDLMSLELAGMDEEGNRQGISLDTVTSVELRRGYTSISRENRRTSLSLTLYTDREDLDRLAREIDAAAAAFDWPRGYALEKGDRFRALEEGAEDRRFALVLAITFVFLLMGVLFESIRVPFVILFSIPFAFVGVYWTLYLTGTPFDTMAGVGMVLLVGIVVNNAIVLIDRVQELRRAGRGIDRAIAEGARDRLRPILMTALTTIFGLVPMAIGTSALVGIPYAPLGRAVIGGLIASTLTTLVVVPLVYRVILGGRTDTGPERA
ncbi:MAG: efflux RND transporter permease subunit [Deltaproteobacteria bacterium]|nr:MAG: efflux RND transporter permease subunit [Deltaproteobacteria bacterium]